MNWSKILSSGAVEVVAGLLILSVDVFPSSARSSLTPQVLAVDVAALAVVFVTLRRPRLGAALAIIACVAAVVMDPQSRGLWPHILMLPVVTTLRLGRWSLAAITFVTVVAASVTATARRLGADFRAMEVILGWLVLHSIIALFGLGLYAASRYATEQEAQRTRALRLQTTLRLHDSVTRELAVIAMEAETAQRHGGANPEELSSIAARARDAGAALRETMRFVAGDASPEPELGFAEVLADGTASLARAGITLKVEGDLKPNLPPDIDLAAGRILTEALHNVCKHGKRNGRCHLVTERTDEGFDFTLTNERAANCADDGGLGLIGMSHTARSVGGTAFATHTVDDWVCQVRLPLAVRGASR